MSENLTCEKCVWHVSERTLGSKDGKGVRMDKCLITTYIGLVIDINNPPCKGESAVYCFDCTPEE